MVSLIGLGLMMAISGLIGSIASVLVVLRFMLLSWR